MNKNWMLLALLLGGLFLLRNKKPLATAPGVETVEFWESPAGMVRQEYDVDIGI